MRELVWLSHLRVENSEIDILEEYFPDLSKAFFPLDEEISSRLLPSTVKKLSKKIDEEYFKKLDTKCSNEGIKIITYLDEDYPPRLHSIENSPKVLYVKGDVKLLSGSGIGIVGSRKHSNYGELVTKKIVEDLAGTGTVIFSGMAFGIDTLAHKNALKNNLPTVAVLGNGVDIVYPASNSKLYLDILSSGGAIVSEYPPGEIARKHYFPERNRIISGLSKALIVVEAQEKSGSLITARLAAEQGRDVYAVPGNINSIYSKGTNGLIKDGAIPYTCIEDLSNIIDFKKNIVENQLHELTLEEHQVMEVIKSGVRELDLIGIKLGMDIPYLNRLITLMELKGLVESVGYNTFEIKIGRFDG